MKKKILTLISLLITLAVVSVNALAGNNLRINYADGSVNVLYVSTYYQNHDVVISVIDIDDDSIIFAEQLKTDENGVARVDGIEITDDGNYVVNVAPLYGTLSSGDVINGAYGVRLWTIAAQSEDADEIYEKLDVLLSTFFLTVGYDEYISDMYDFCSKLSANRDAYPVDGQDAEDVEMLDKAFYELGVLTACQDIRSSTDKDAAREIFDAALALTEDAEFVERLVALETDDKATFDDIYAEFVKSLKAFESFGDFESMVKSIYNKYMQEVALGTFKNLTHSSQINDILSDANIIQILGIEDLAEEYAALSSTKTVDTALFDKNFKDARELIDALEAAIKKAKKEEKEHNNQNNRPSSGGGGGGSAANAIGSVPQTVVQPEPEQTATGTFADLSGYEWARSCIETLANAGVVNGKGQGVFDPAGRVLREEAAKMIVEAFGVSASSEGASFEDVSSDAWYADYVYTAKNAGIVKGIADNLFGTGLSITRQDAAVMLYTALVSGGYASEGQAELSFTDAHLIADYAKAAISYMSLAGAVNGYEDGSFRPSDSISRAEFAVILGRVLDTINK